nr:protein STICHEL [Ipomoea batatas]
MSSEMRRRSYGGSGGGGVGNSFDPSNLHLKRELTQIKKAAKALRDPGTTSSWRSPLGSARSTLAEESIEDSLSDARNGGNDSKSDTYAGDRYASMILKCKDANFMPSIRRNIKKKSKKNNFSTAILRHNSDKLQQQMASSRIPRRVLEGLPGLGLGLGGDDSASLVDQSEDTEDYSNAEDFRRFSAASPLLARLRSKNWAYSSSKFRNSRRRREDSSYTYSTPALSTSSYNRYGVRNPSTVGSWDGTTQSFNDGDDDDEGEDQLDLPRSSRRSTPKYRAGYGSCYSPSLSDTLRRKGSSIFCGSQTVYQRRRRRSSLDYNKRRHGSRAVAQGLIPLLTNGDDGPGGSSMGTGISDDELSTNFGELDLEALSRLDGRRWSTSCKSQDGLELVAFNGEEEEEGSPENIRSLCQKYRPTFFEELIGQTIVVQSLMNAISRGRIAPVYLLQGPRGTGKTSTARIFAAALNCLATEETKPCGVCRECADFISGKCKNVREVDGTNKKGIDKVKYLLKSLSVAHQSTSSGYKVFVIDECHLLPSKTWLAFLKFLEEPPPCVVFVFITTDLDNVPRAILSRCQKYLFNKIRDNDIVIRLKKIVADENLDVEPEALELIALNADGSLRDAETMLDQLSLLGKRITTSLVNDLVGVVSDEKLLELLELAMSSDTAETVKRARELLDSGIDPIVLMSQLATLIMDIIAGTHPSIDAKPTDSSFIGKSLSEVEVDRLKHALKLLSDAEKQLRVSSERSTWFTATLLQLGSVPSPDQTHSGSSRRQSSKATEEDPSTSTFREVVSRKQQKGDSLYAPCKLGSPSSFAKGSHRISSSKDLGYAKITQSKLISGESLASQDELKLGKTVPRSLNTNMLDDIWVRCIEKCHSNTLKQLLHTCGTLVSMSEIDSVFVAHIAFRDNEIKTRAERFLSSITNSFENVLRRNVDVRLVLLPEEENSASSTKLIALQDSSPKQMDTSSIINKETTICSNALGEYSGHEPLHASSGSFNDRDGKLVGGFECTSGNAKINSSKERISEIPVQRIESIIHEQRLETAWLQAMEKGTPGSLNRLKPERNQVLPQDGIYHDNQLESMASLDLSSQHWQDELKDELKNLKMSDEINPKDPNNKMADYPISPRDMNLDQEHMVAVAFYVGITPNLKEGGRSKGLLFVQTEMGGFRGLGSARKGEQRIIDTEDDDDNRR